MIKDGRIKTVELKNVRLLPTDVDLFSDGSLLIVQSRCDKEGSYIERNARRYNPNGQLIDAFTLGDGINSVQIDETDTIWVSYFDEGIFGSSGWNEPWGSDGVIAYTKNGQKLWGAGTYGIIDCYAMNVAGVKEVYFYYYADFFLVQLAGKKEVNRYRVEGEDTLQQFIFDEAGFIGQVNGNVALKRFRIRNRTITPKGKLKLVDENGKRITGSVFMRGKYLYVYGKEGIYKRKL
ncbi:hypothetical protein SAMN05421736_101130 [Evansella caseinilytica]|uniref:Uncharacterized protein n=1 Tax=Evansella caseinilytica TaxID=1503961 RepID=A0A1H3GCD4_9BACI|nr:hypothetical protein [Evansella caseinilytica]SDY00931.1 hypothetical protein SAMN05421736_101130 [Evansella caseinilytica]